MSDFSIVTTRGGARAVLDRTTGEVMHPVVGPLVEAAALYLEPSRLCQRLEGDGDPLVLWDVGLGAGSNAIAAWRASEARGGGRPLHIVSFDRTTDALALALEHPASFALDGDAGVAARRLIEHGRCEGTRTRWQLVAGELPATLERARGAADIVFWDPFSLRANPTLWNTAAFRAVFGACSATATLHTYSAATSVRAAMLLGGFAVGFGVATGAKSTTTSAAVRAQDLDAPLDHRWLERLARSSAPLPPDAPADALTRIRAMPQFARGL